MPAEAKGPRLWFKPGNIGADGKRRPGYWIIKDDDGVRISTGVRAARAGKAPAAAQDALARYIIEKREVPRQKQRGADAILIADVIAIKDNVSRAHLTGTSREAARRVLAPAVAA